MKNIKYLIIFFGILYASHAFSENDYDIKILPEIYKSKSGIEFIIHEKHNSEIITMNLYFKNSGYIYEKDNQKGISTLATILLKKYATTNIGIDEFSKHLFKKGIVINFSNYADGIIMDVMCLSHDLSETLDYVTMLIGENKKIDGNLFKNTKKILIENIENETKNINYIAYKELTNALLNTADPYYESIEHNIEKITRNDINNFIDSHFSLNNVIISVAGDINKKDFRDILDKHLILSKKSDKINIKHLDHSNIFNEKKENKSIHFKGGDQHIISFALPSLYLNGKPKRDSGEYYAQMLLINKLQRSGDGYLFKYLRGNLGLTYSSYAHIASYDNLEYIYGKLLTNNSNKLKVIEAFNEMLNDISQGVTKEELQAMKATYIGEMIVTLGFSSIDYTYTMLNMLEGSYPLNYLSKLIDNINKVTVSDINKVAKQIFDKNKLVLISVGDDEKEKS